MGSPMVNVAAHQAKQGGVAILGQRRQVNGAAIGAGPVAADYHIHPVLSPQCGCQQRQGIDNVFVLNHDYFIKKPPESVFQGLHKLVELFLFYNHTQGFQNFIVPVFLDGNPVQHMLQHFCRAG